MRLLVVGVACAFVLAGCGGDPKADPTTSPTSSSPSATPSPPVMPDAAKANTKAGAVAFVKYYIELINHAQATGDVEALAAVEDRACESCKHARDALSAIYDAGGSVQGGALTFEPISRERSPRYQGWLISGSLRSAPQTVTREAGATPEQLTGGDTVVNAFVSQANPDRAWRVMNWTRGS